MCTAVALSAYAVYQSQVEMPRLCAYYQANRNVALAQAGVDASDASSVARFESRLLGSIEPTATFALANSLAGFLVGPAVVGLALGFRAFRKSEDGRPRDSSRSSWPSRSSC